MEPDHDKIIAGRVRQTELTPVNWDKAGVWSRVQSQSAPPLSMVRPLYQYAAAAAAVLIIVLWLSRGDDTAIPDEASVVPEKMATNPLPAADETEKAPAPAIDQPVVEISPPAKKPSGNVIVSIEEKPEVLPVIYEDEEIEIAVNEDVTATQIIDAVESGKVEPIVGVYYPSGPEVEHSRKKKKTWLRKQSDEEAHPWDDDFKNRIVIARKK